MTDITAAILEIKTKVTLEEWQQRILDCRQSGMTVRAWCRENGIAPSSYYHYLHKIRESVLKENHIVPHDTPKPSSEIHIRSGNITVTLPESVSPAQLRAVLSTLNLKE